MVVHCQTGARSAIAASVLRANGIDAVNLTGGFAAWTHAGHAVERETAADEPVDTSEQLQNR